jgi:hypothetical protein
MNGGFRLLFAAAVIAAALGIGATNALGTLFLLPDDVPDRCA